MNNASTSLARGRWLTPISLLLALVLQLAYSLHRPLPDVVLDYPLQLLAAIVRHYVLDLWVYLYFALLLACGLWMATRQLFFRSGEPLRFYHLMMSSAPLAGLFGSTISIIRTWLFLEPERLGTAQALSEGLALAMVPTACGLFVSLIGSCLRFATILKRNG